MPTDKRQRQKEGQRARREAAHAALRRQQRKRRGITAAVAIVVVLAVMLLISAVGGDDESDVTADSDRTTSSTSTTVAEETTKVDPADKPAVGIPDEPPPSALRIDDVTVGDGREAKVGDRLEVNYVGVTYADGEEFDSSWDRGETSIFALDENNLIEGWVEGIPGMKVGGRRRLIIPGSMAYGDEDTGTGRPFGALVFVIDLVDIK